MPKIAGTPAKRRPLIMLMGVFGCLAFFSLSSPRAVPSIMLIVGFAVLGLLGFCLLDLLLAMLALRDRLKPAVRRGVLVAGTVVPVLLLMLQSLGQLTVRDVLVLAGLFAVGLFYASRFGV